MLGTWQNCATDSTTGARSVNQAGAAATEAGWKRRRDEPTSSAPVRTDVRLAGFALGAACVAFLHQGGGGTRRQRHHGHGHGQRRCGSPHSDGGLLARPPRGCHYCGGLPLVQSQVGFSRPVPSRPAERLLKVRAEQGGWRRVQQRPFLPIPAQLTGRPTSCNNISLEWLLTVHLHLPNCWITGWCESGRRRVWVRYAGAKTIDSQLRRITQSHVESA